MNRRYFCSVLRRRGRWLTYFYTGRAWKVDGFSPYKYDIIGALVTLTGACIIIYMPRNAV
ncbi:hypothetical protein AB6735_23550 [Mucilaginibacter sp. RCC_168]|uniref:hypothetical protein n=1 Tax=Mucilaginibacter sp. RCC_168 TaxID=3239221 RepID=UPI0035237528